MSDGGLEGFEIRCEGLISFELPPEVVQQQRRAAALFFHETVEHAISVAAVSNEPCAFQVVEMTGHRRLRDVQDVLKVATAQLAAGEQEIDNPQACPVRQAHEKVLKRHQHPLFRRWRRWGQPPLSNVFSAWSAFRATDVGSGAYPNSFADR